MKIKTLLLILIYGCLSCHDKKTTVSGRITPKITICIQPFENFPASEVQMVAKNLRKLYKNIVIKKPIPFPETSWNYNKTRRRADVLIAYLTEMSGKEELYIGLTSKDISTSKGTHSDWGVFGLGYKPGKSCIASSYRLKGNVSQKLFKVAIHELGHTQGLSHCPIQNCLMRDAEGKDHLNEETEFCKHCKSLLIQSGWNLK